MNLDLSTLTVAGGLVAFVSGLLLIVSWLQYGGGRAALRLGISHLIAAGAIVLLAMGSGHDPLLTFLAHPAFVVAAFLVLSAVLAFEGRRSWFIVPACAAAAVAALFVIRLLGGESSPVRDVQLAIVFPVYLIAAEVLWRGRRERLRARLPMIVLLVLHGAMNGVGLAEQLLDATLPTGIPSFSQWFGLIHIESMLYLIGTTVFMVGLIKERSEAGHRRASMTDPLTGLPNRRAFFTSCNKILARCASDPVPASLIAVDLDRFKIVNDSFGHAVGDSVLQIFAAVSQEHSRPFDIVGRIGGEEFAILLPGTHGRQGAEIAERIRSAFSRATQLVDDCQVAATLSAGVAVIYKDMSVMEALERADAALYRAKLDGRDCVVLDNTERGPRLVRTAS